MIRDKQVCCPFSVLGVSRDASLEEIRSRYLILARTHHPDKLGHLTEDERREHEKIFQKVSVAYEVACRMQGDDLLRDSRDGDRDRYDEDGERDEFDDWDKWDGWNEWDWDEWDGRDMKDGRQKAKWAKMWTNIEEVIRDPSRLRTVLKGTFQDVATYYKKRLLPRRIKLHVSLDDVCQRKLRVVQIKLADREDPLYLRINCGDFPKVVIDDHPDHSSRVILDMHLLDHDVFSLDKDGTLRSCVRLNLVDYIQGKTMVLPNPCSPGSDLTVHVPGFHDVHEVIRLSGSGWKEGKDLEVRVNVDLPSRDGWEKLDNDAQGAVIKALELLSY